MHLPKKHEQAGSRVYTSFLTQLLRNYLFGSAVAVVGVGGGVVFSTLSIPSNERFVLGAIMTISLVIMIFCELFVFYRHLRPIQVIFKAQQPTSEQLKNAYLHTHKFPVLSVRRTYGPHFLGLLLPAVSMAIVFIKLGYMKLPYFYIGIAAAVAFMIASMHAMIEFFLTTKAIRPVVTHIRNWHMELYNQDITLSGKVLVSIRTKFRLSAFLIGTLPLLLFGLASQIRLDNIQGEGSLAYWQWAGIILIIGIIYSLLGASLLSRNIEDPIHTIQNGMSSVQEGNFETSAADIYSDEFSKLVAGFNHMVNGLKEREQRNNQLLHSYFMTLAAALDARDAYTAGHSTRVARFSVQIGRLDGWSASEIELLHKTALLHDIGKIGVRDAVLLKEGRLTDEEFDQIKLHPVLGENILKQIEPADAMAELLPGVRSHHERYDGKGYPDGLVGTDIPLFGRAIAIADAFDAMTSDRPYRKGMTYERALSILEEGKGTQWDPKLTQLFIDSLRLKDNPDENAS
ncbi:HD domain-containing phosphohydrolase [Paenibacillus sp. LHD-38]|uniref:HD-GYP domain-containing protein n=1 Tax=Paenibacillus sp. LHD-38 TaxID=3072143 RepID=UPI0028102353|nr:HD domain-containing phosphohydrolase [Paenibacillus sp. LHD-38]MDQ8736124.1 HD domain-containing protein [Paenibacillus sp. LHD-38]